MSENMSGDVFQCSFEETQLSGSQYNTHQSHSAGKTTNGLSCTWSYQTNGRVVHMKLSFYWNALKESRGIIGFAGKIFFKMDTEKYSIDVELNEGYQTVERLYNWAHMPIPFISSSFTLTPIIKPIPVYYNEMFQKSEKTDAILEVEGRHLHVNKSFLSFHSDYFSSLFSSNFKEGSMDVIPIKDITYEEIGMLLGVIYPISAFFHDRDIPKLLELADRFLLPSVTHHVEYHLIHNSKISYDKMIWLADRYGMHELFQKTISELSSIYKLRELKKSSEYIDLSDKAKAVILDEVMKFI